MVIRATNKDVQAFLNQTSLGLASVDDHALASAMTTAEKLVEIENETNKRLQATDLVAASERESGTTPASSVLVMAYLAVKYPELAKNVSPTAVKTSLAKQFDELAGARPMKMDSSWTGVWNYMSEYDLPPAVMRDLIRFVTPTMTTGKSLDEVLGTGAMFGFGPRRVRVEPGTISIESQEALLVLEVRDGKLDATVARKTAAGFGAPEVVKLASLSPHALESLKGALERSPVPSKPKETLAARAWEAEHGASRATVDAAVHGLADMFRKTRLEIFNAANTTTDDFAPALDAFFRSVRPKELSWWGHCAMTYDNYISSNDPANRRLAFADRDQDGVMDFFSAWHDRTSSYFSRWST
jgi:hypothetical protein